GKPRELACWDFATSNDVEGFAICDEVIPSPVLVRGMIAEAAPGHPTWSLRVRNSEIDGTTEAEAIAAGDFIEVTLAPHAGQSMSLAKLAFEHRGTPESAGVTFSVRSSVDGFSSSLGKVTSIRSTRWNQVAVVLPSAPFQGLSSDVTMRIYLTGPPAHPRPNPPPSTASRSTARPTPPPPSVSCAVSETGCSDERPAAIPFQPGPPRDAQESIPDLPQICANRTRDLGPFGDDCVDRLSRQAGTGADRNRRLLAHANVVFIILNDTNGTLSAVIVSNRDRRP
ncbi:MAG: hypothetical protein KJ579_12480, partial [Verrucomicrobia bacterium]|nr:hypothetical protein [Verrucomicrobiota bacterium]